MSGRQFSLVAEIPPYQLLNPAADAAGRTSGYVTLKNSIKAYLVCHLTQGNAATVQFTPLQAQDVSGTGSKALSANVPIFSSIDVSLTSLLTSRTAAANYTTDAGLKNKTIVFEILPEACMDLANGFRTIAIQTGASNAANITCAEILTLAQIKALGASQPNILAN